MLPKEIVNARIERTQLGPESHGIFSAYLMLRFGSCGQSFGGYSLDAHVESPSFGGERLKAPYDRIGTAYGMTFIARTMWAVGVASWEELTGKYCRIETEGNGGLIRAIGHIVEDRWFRPDDMQREFFPEASAA